MDTLALQLSEASGVPFYRQIEDQIATLIRSGTLPAGARLPSVRELSQQTLVSLITVRRAYADLDRDGLIVRRQGQGTFVAEGHGVAGAARAHREGAQELGRAVERAKALGLTDDAVRQIVEQALGSAGD